MESKNEVFTDMKAEFYSSIIREILNCYAVEQYLSSLILTLCCIDYMGVPLADFGKNKGKHFKQFLEQYMGEVNSKYKEQEIQETIWDIRCSLVHTFGDAQSLGNIKPILVIGATDREHLLFNDNHFSLSVPHFISETISRVEKFFRETVSNDMVTIWRDKLYIFSGVPGLLNKLNTVQSEKIVYSNIHNFLSMLDEQPDCTITELCEGLKIRLINKYHSHIEL